MTSVKTSKKRSCIKNESFFSFGVTLCLILFISRSVAGQELTIDQQNANIPTQFASLYKEIEESLDQATQLFPLAKSKFCPSYAPELYFAGSGYSTTSRYWKDLLTTIDAFRAMKLNAISVMIASPDLTVGDSLSIINFYQHLIEEVHRRSMKLCVEYFDNPPFSPHAYKDLQDTPDGRRDFLNRKKKEIFLIYNKIQPDYFSIITEPGTMMRWTHLNFSVNELAEWVGEITTTLKNSGEKSHTLIGAGAGSWESEKYVVKFAQQENLDYIDIHFYALNSSIKGDALRFDSLVHKIRQIRPDMEITIGETWLYKRSEKEAATLAMYRETFFRDNFSFWSSLDQKFLRLVTGIAQKDNISIVVPYFSQYLFTYYVFNDPETSKLPQWPISIPFSWNKAIEVMNNHQISETGKALSLIVSNSCY